MALNDGRRICRTARGWTFYSDLPAYPVLPRPWIQTLYGLSLTLQTAAPRVERNAAPNDGPPAICARRITGENGPFRPGEGEGEA